MINVFAFYSYIRSSFLWAPVLKTAALANNPSTFLELSSATADVLTPLTCALGRPKRNGEGLLQRH